MIPLFFTPIGLGYRALDIQGVFLSGIGIA
jgi:hypothetical protein